MRGVGVQPSDLIGSRSCFLKYRRDSIVADRAVSHEWVGCKSHEICDYLMDTARNRRFSGPRNAERGSSIALDPDG